MSTPTPVIAAHLGDHLVIKNIHLLLLYTSLLLVMIILLVFIMYVNNVISLVLPEWWKLLVVFCNIWLNNNSRKNTDKMVNSKTKKKTAYFS